MIAETSLHPADLMYPLFLNFGEGAPEPIPSLPGIFRFSQSDLEREIEAAIALGIRSFVLFPAVPEKFKDKLLNKFRDDGLHIVTAGGTAGMFSAIISGWVAAGERGSQLVSQLIKSNHY